MFALVAFCFYELSLHKKKLRWDLFTKDSVHSPLFIWKCFNKDSGFCYCFSCSFMIFQEVTIFFYNTLRFTTKLRGRHRDFPYALCPHTCVASPVINIPHQRGTFFNKDESKLTHKSLKGHSLPSGFTLGVFWV